MVKKAKPTVLYTVKTGKSASGDAMFSVAKMSKDLEVLSLYYIHESSRGGLTCSCPAHVAYCRHCEILRLFQGLSKVDTGAFYNYDTKQWIDPIQQEA